MRGVHASHAFLLLCSITLTNYLVAVSSAKSITRAGTLIKTRKECRMTKYFTLMDRFFVSAVAVTGVWYLGALSQMI